MSSFSIPLTGLEASSTALNTIANNLSNMNTTAFKSQNVTFSDLFYQQIGNTGSGDALQVGAGTRVGATDTDFAGGSITSTGNATDIAINGDGFFVVQSGGSTEYTRAGNFTTDAQGNLTTQDGAQVMGYPAVNGVVNPNGVLQPITLPIGQVEKPAQTANLNVTATLDASATSTSAAEQAGTQIYDSLGVSHTATIAFSRDAAVPASDTVANVVSEWTGTVSIPASDGTATSATVSLGFDNSGNLLSINGNPTALAGGSAAHAAISFSGLTDGAANLNFNWNFVGSNNLSTISQVQSSAGIGAITQDGYAGGQYETFTVDSSGVVSAKFDNGQTTPIGQIALASIVNEQGLVRAGSGNYETTLASGSATVGVAGSAGRGTLQDESLEGSNVDISTQFSDLIVAQQAFEASSKAITTFDSISQETINMIH